VRGEGVEDGSLRTRATRMVQPESGGVDWRSESQGGAANGEEQKEGKKGSKERWWWVYRSWNRFWTFPMSFVIN